MKTVKGIVYEGKAPFMTWDIEKDIENQIASTKAEFIEEYGEEIKAEYLDKNKDNFKAEYLDKNKDNFKAEYFDKNKDNFKAEYLDKNKDKIKEEYLNQLTLETIEQRDIAFIKNMLKEKYPLKDIAKITNKSIEEIKKISES